MRFLGSIRWRLQLWYGLLLAAVLGAFGLTAYRLESARQNRRLDEELRQRLPALVESQHPVRGNHELREFVLSPRGAALFDGPGEGGFYHVVWLRHSLAPVTYSATAPRDVPMPAVGDPPTRQRGPLREAFLFTGPGDCLLVGRSVAADAAALRQSAWRLAGVGLGVLLLGLTVGSWGVTRALRPIGEITSAAQRIATGDLTQRVQTKESHSELGRLATVLNSTFGRLDAAFAQQARFTADAAHELRTPLAVILTHSQNGLSEPCAAGEHHEAFAAIERAARRMHRLAGSLLDLARLEADPSALRREDCDLQDLVSEGVELLRPLAAAQGVELRLELGTVRSHVDRDRLAQAVDNLLSNAVEYNYTAGGWVSVSLHREGDTAVLGVKNSGPGIPAAEIGRVFDRFHRCDSARAGGGTRGHTGLGLAIARAIVLAHGGTLSAQSNELETTFELRIPAGLSST